VGLTYGDACEGIAAQCDDDDKGFKGFGGFRFNRNLAAELGFVDLGEASSSGPLGSASIKTDGIEIAALGILPLNPQFDLFGKVGLYRWDLSGSVPGGTASGDGTDLVFGFGGNWQFARQLGLRAEWERFTIDEDHINFVSLGLQFHF
jgi:OOP family OmpA-OmpF porin